MAKRHVHPALYEIIRSKNPGRSAPSFAAETDSPSTSAEAGSVAGPTTVRVPIGYVWLAAALAVVALAGTYMIGYSLGERAADRRRAQFLEDRVGALGGLEQVSDPLVAGPIGANPGRPSTEQESPDRSNAGASPRPAEPGGARGLPAGPADPRVADLYYFVLAHPDPDRAPDMVAFLRSNGLDAHLVPDHNGSLRKVIVLPGYATSADRSSSEAIKQLEARIRSVGRKWKDHAKGNTDLGDYFPEQYRPAKGRS